MPWKRKPGWKPKPKAETAQTAALLIVLRNGDRHYVNCTLDVAKELRARINQAMQGTVAYGIVDCAPWDETTLRVDEIVRVSYRPGKAGKAKPETQEPPA